MSLSNKVGKEFASIDGIVVGPIGIGNDFAGNVGEKENERRPHHGQNKTGEPPCQYGSLFNQRSWLVGYAPSVQIVGAVVAIGCIRGLFLGDIEW